MRDKIIDAVVNAICEIERAGEPGTIAGPPPRKALWHLAGMEQARAEYARCIRAVLVAIEASGYAVVPVEPTEAMLASAFSEALVPAGDAIACYAAMLAASPKVTT